jgi:hypothetical protein
LVPGFFHAKFWGTQKFPILRSLGTVSEFPDIRHAKSLARMARD